VIHEMNYRGCRRWPCRAGERILYAQSRLRCNDLQKEEHCVCMLSYAQY